MSKKPNAHTSKRPKRPKSVFAKGWETRRRNQLLRDSENMGVPGNPVMGETNADPRDPNVYQQSATLRAANQASPIPPSSPSAIDAIENTLRLQRDEQLCGFMADLLFVRQHVRGPVHAPMVVTRSQIDAIEEFLSEHGYSAFGMANRAKAA